jgi:dipeptidyl aminopeptidase/acylaminoacyl peptidase
MRKLLLCFGLAVMPMQFCTAQSAPAQPTAPARRPMTFDDMMHMKRLGDTAVSPDGKWLAYSVTTVSLDQNTVAQELWVQAIASPGAEPKAAQKLTVGQPGDSGVQFAPDGRSVLFLSNRENGQQVWRADFDPATGATGNAEKLTHIATGADNAIWSPDGRSVLFTSGVYPDCSPITAANFKAGNQCNADRDAAASANPAKAQIFTHSLYRHWDHFTGDKRSHLFLVSIDNGTVRDLNPGDTEDVPPFSLEGGGCGCAFAPDSKQLAFTEKLADDPAISTNSDIFTLDLTDPAAKPVKVSPSLGGDLSPAYSPDGKYLAWRSQARAGYESDKFQLALYDRQTKTIKILLPNLDLWIDEFAWSANSHYIAFTSDMRGEAPIYVTSPTHETAMQITRAGEFSDLHWVSLQDQPGAAKASDFGGMLATEMHVDLPSEAALIRIGDTTFEKVTDQPAIDDIDVSPIALVTHINDGLLAQLELPKMESFWFPATDGAKLEGFLIRPPGFDAAQKYPVKFLMHGGPQGNWGDDWSYRWNAELFAANGYVAVMINPRGSTGYGQAIVDGVNGDWGGKPFTDLMEGLDYAEQHYVFIDKSRECALGASYGGYMANWVLGHTDRFRCIVTHDGMFNPESAYGTTDELWFNEWEFKGKPWDYYGLPDSENPYRKWAPMLSAKNFKTPTLVIHGQLDYRLDASEGFQIFDTLQRLGIPSKLLYFPNEGHWVLQPRDSQLWYKTVNDWVDEWTKAATGH